MDTIFEGDQHPFTSAKTIGIHSFLYRLLTCKLTHIQIIESRLLWFTLWFTLSGWWFQTFFMFHFIYGMSSFPLTNSIIFQDG